MYVRSIVRIAVVEVPGQPWKFDVLHRKGAMPKQAISLRFSSKVLQTTGNSAQAPAKAPRPLRVTRRGFPSRLPFTSTHQGNNAF